MQFLLTTLLLPTINRQTNKQTNIQTDKQTERQTDRQISKQTDQQTAGNCSAMEQGLVQHKMLLLAFTPVSQQTLFIIVERRMRSAVSQQCQNG